MSEPFVDLMLVLRENLNKNIFSVWCPNSKLDIDQFKIVLPNESRKQKTPIDRYPALPQKELNQL
jgi:hypothetical protein